MANEQKQSELAVRMAVAAGRQELLPYASALLAAREAIRHLRDCGSCGEGGLDCCGDGRQALDTLAQLERLIGS